MSKTPSSSLSGHSPINTKPHNFEGIHWLLSLPIFVVFALFCYTVVRLIWTDAFWSNQLLWDDKLLMSQTQYLRSGLSLPTVLNPVLTHPDLWWRPIGMLLLAPWFNLQLSGHLAREGAALYFSITCALWGVFFWRMASHLKLSAFWRLAAPFTLMSLLFLHPSVGLGAVWMSSVFVVVASGFVALSSIALLSSSRRLQYLAPVFFLCALLSHEWALFCGVWIWALWNWRGMALKDYKILAFLFGTGIAAWAAARLIIFGAIYKYPAVAPKEYLTQIVGWWTQSLSIFEPVAPGYFALTNGLLYAACGLLLAVFFSGMYLVKYQHKSVGWILMALIVFPFLAVSWQAATGIEGALWLTGPELLLFLPFVCAALLEGFTYAMNRSGIEHKSWLIQKTSVVMIMLIGLMFASTLALGSAKYAKQWSSEWSLWKGALSVSANNTLALNNALVLASKGSDTVWLSELMKSSETAWESIAKDPQPSGPKLAFATTYAGLLDKDGQGSKAMGTLELLVPKSAKYPPLALMYAQLAYQNKNYQDTLAALNFLVQGFERRQWSNERLFANVLGMRAQTQLDLGNMEEAKKDQERANGVKTQLTARQNNQSRAEIPTSTPAPTKPESSTPSNPTNNAPQGSVKAPSHIDVQPPKTPSTQKDSN